MTGAEIGWLMANVGAIGLGLSFVVLVSLSLLVTAMVLATMGEM
jgi:hypothetical protein